MIKESLHSDFIWISSIGILLHTIQHLNFASVNEFSSLYWDSLGQSATEIVCEGTNSGGGFRIVEIIRCHSLPMIKVLQKFIFLHFLEFFSVVFNLIRAFVREVFVFFIQLLLVFLPFSFRVFLLSLMIGWQKVLFHEFLNHFLSHMILFELVRDKPAELLLLEQFDMPIKVLETPLHLDLLHVQIKHLLVVHLVVAHEHSLPEFLVEVRRVNHT